MGGPGPKADLSFVLDGRAPELIADESQSFTDHAGGWLDLMTAASGLHMITRACMGFHLCSLTGHEQHGDQMEAAVTAGRIAAIEGKGAVFVPPAMGGARGCSPNRDAPSRRHRSLVDTSEARNKKTSRPGSACFAERHIATGGGSYG